jgi:hypothetical protein
MPDEVAVKKFKKTITVDGIEVDVDAWTEEELEAECKRAEAYIKKYGSDEDKMSSDYPRHEGEDAVMDLARELQINNFKLM